MAKGLAKGTLRLLLSDPAAAFSQGAADDLKKAASTVREVLEATGDADAPERRLWQLIRNGLIQALANLLDEQRHIILPRDAPSLILEFNVEEISTQPITATASFINSPRIVLRQLGVRQAIGKSLENAYELPPARKDFMLSQLDRLFDLAVWLEYNQHQDYYRAVFECLDSRFSGSARWYAAAAEHSVRLDAFRQNPVLGAAFALEDIYVDVRAAMWVPPKERNKGHFSIVPAGDYLEKWLKSEPLGLEGCVRFVSGGPGTGKSSLAGC